MEVTNLKRTGGRRRGRRRLLPAVLLVVGISHIGCWPFAPPELIENENPQVVVPTYVQMSKTLGIWPALELASMLIPPWLYDVPGLDGEGPFEVETIADVPFKETSSRTLTLNVHRPKSDDARLRRAIVIFMGGGNVIDDDFRVMEVWSWYLASRGFVVFNTRQRLLTEAGVTPFDVMSDALATVRFVGADGPSYDADPERIAVFGRSSGGQLALLVGMFPDPEALRQPSDPDGPVNVSAIVASAALIDPARLATGEDFTAVPQSDFVRGFGGTPAEVPESYAAASPMTYVRPDLPPTMIAHGVLDTTVSISQAIRLADALEAAGNDVYRYFDPQAGHVLGWGLLNNDGFGRAMVEITRFLEQRL